jgi:hypothetical protein
LAHVRNRTRVHSIVVNIDKVGSILSSRLGIQSLHVSD